MPIYREKYSKDIHVDCLLVKGEAENIEFVKANMDICSAYVNVSKNRIDECDVDYYELLYKKIIGNGYRSVGVILANTEADFFLSLKMRTAFEDAIFISSFSIEDDMDIDIVFIEKTSEQSSLKSQYVQYMTLANLHRGKDVEYSFNEELDEILLEECKNKNKDFVDTMLFWISKKKIEKDSLVYRKANMTPQTYNKIINRVRFPSFEKAVQLAIGLMLSKDEAVDFVSRAGFAFKPFDEREQFLLSLIGQKNLSVVDVNDQLYFRGYDTLTIRGDDIKEEKISSGRSR